MKLYKHQKDIVDKNPARHLLAFGTGVGKTITSLALAEKNNVDCLIIVPKALKENWVRNIKQFSQNHHVISKEELRKNWDRLPAYNGIIVDEFHFFGNLKSLLSKSLIAYQKKHNPVYFWGLTATPYCSSPMNIYTLARHLGHVWDYWKFFNKFFAQVPMGRRLVPVQRRGMEYEVANLVKSIGTTCTLEECADIPEQSFETIYFDLTPAQKKAIKEIDDVEAITRWTRTHTISNGVKIGDGYIHDEFFECLKNDYIASFSDENPKFAVICRYNLQIENIKNILEKKGKKVFVISGQVKNRDEIVQQVELTDECVVLIQASTAVGFEIPSIKYMLFASLSFSHVDHIQALGRIHRVNNLKNNFYQYLVVQGTVDEAVYKSIMSKKDFDIAIYDKEYRMV